MSGINNLFIGDKNAEAVYVGDKECELLYLGDKVVYQKGASFVEDYMFNYNAKEFNASTHTFPKKSGQLFDEDLVLVNTVSEIYDDYVRIYNNYMLKSYASTASNPFNRGNGQPTDFTFIYKANFLGGGTIVGNRGGNYNWMVRRGSFNNRSASMAFEPSQQPCTIIITVDSSGNGLRKCIETNQSASETITFGSMSNAIGFFSDRGDMTAELFNGNFYWMFCANRKLTDAEIQTVIDYNNNL